MLAKESMQTYSSLWYATDCLQSVTIGCNNHPDAGTRCADAISATSCVRCKLQ